MGNKLISLLGRMETDFDQRTKKRKTSVPDVFPQSKFDFQKDS
jgi:predicted DNA-binding WGR domain protein